MIVYKFGGASVKDAEGVKNLANIVGLVAGEPLLVVVSAMGKTTNTLENLTKAYINRDNTESIFERIKSYHFGIIEDLFDKQTPEYILEDISNSFVEIDWILEEEPQDTYDFIYDQIVSVGELISTKIIANYLNHIGLKTSWVDARTYIQTDNTYREGKLNQELSYDLIRNEIPSILKKSIVLTQGFIGGTSENFTTTLGREGSDYTAAIFASALQAKSLTIWKDVPGVLNADPKLFDITSKYEHIPYSEAIEMTYYGATVIHPKTIKPLQNAGIKLLVKPFLQPAEKGTEISSLSVFDTQIPAIIVKKNQLLLSISTHDFAFIAEDNLSVLFGIFAENQIKINVMQLSALSFSVCIDDDKMKTKNLLNILKNEFKVLYNEDLELITIRHYNQETIDKITLNKEVLLEQRSRNTIQLVLK